MTELNANHKRVLLNAFKRIDHLFCEIESLLHLENCKSSFPRYFADVNTAQRDNLEAKISEFRKVMHRILEKKGISIDQPLMSIRHVTYTTLQFVDIAIQELSPRRMRGYGTPSRSAALELENIVLELRSMVKDIETALSQNDRNEER